MHAIEKNKVSQHEVIRQLRFPMIVLVTFVHSYGEVAEGFSLLASEWNTYEILKLLVSQTLVKVAVPVFFIMSGYLFFANVEKWNLKVYKAKMLRRMKTLLIPYLIWNLLMAVKLRTFSFAKLLIINYPLLYTHRFRIETNTDLDNFPAIGFIGKHISALVDLTES